MAPRHWVVIFLTSRVQKEENVRQARTTAFLVCPSLWGVPSLKDLAETKPVSCPLPCVPFRWNQEPFALKAQNAVLKHILQTRKDNCLFSLHSVFQVLHSNIRLTNTRSQKQCKHLTSGIKNFFKLCSSEKHPKSNSSHSANGGPPPGRRVWAAWGTVSSHLTMRFYSTPGMGLCSRYHACIENKETPPQ